MRNVFTGVLALLFLDVAIAADYMPNQILVKFRDRATVENISWVYSEQSFRDVQLFNLVGVEKWDVAEGQDIERTIEELRKNPNVEFAEPNYISKPYATSSPTAWYGQAAYSVINATSAWNAINSAANPSLITAPKEIVVAVFDTAIDVNNPDLKPYLWTANNGAKKGYDALDQDDDPSPGKCIDPDSGQVYTDPMHGTEVTSVIAGMLEHIRVNTGSTPPIKILPVRLGCTFAKDAEIRAIEYALTHKVDIINASYGSVWYSDIQRNVLSKLRDKDILLVAAAGNYDSNNDQIPNYPSDYDLPNVIAVGATDESPSSDKLATWSQYGPTSVDLAAPGESIYVISGGGVNSSFSPERGTSFSSPMAAAVAAMLMSVTPTKSGNGATVRKVRAALQAGVSPLRDKGFLATDGRLDALGSVNYLKQPAPMIVVRSIRIDDTKGGNGNHELDPGETVDLIVELENFGETAFNVDASASFATAGLAGFTLSATPVRFTSIPSGATAKATFSLSADADKQSFRRLPIRIDVAQVSSSYQVSRQVSVEYGPLKAQLPVKGLIYTNYGNAQDDVQFYHVTVPTGYNFVKFSLSCGSDCKNPGMLSLAAKWGSLPRFGWEEISGDQFVLVRDTTTDVGVSAGSNVSVTVHGGSGNYYVAVVVNQQYSQFGTAFGPLSYSLLAEPGYDEPSKPRSFGCVLSGGLDGVDPTLPALLVGAGWLFVRRRSRG